MSTLNLTRTTATDPIDEAFERGVDMRADTLAAARTAATHTAAALARLAAAAGPYRVTPLHRIADIVRDQAQVLGRLARGVDHVGVSPFARDHDRMTLGEATAEMRTARTLLRNVAETIRPGLSTTGPHARELFLAASSGRAFRPGTEPVVDVAVALENAAADIDEVLERIEGREYLPHVPYADIAAHVGE